MVIRYSFSIQRKGGLSAGQRAQQAGEKIGNLGKKLNLDPDRVWVEHTDIFTDIMYDSQVLVSITDADALCEGVSRDSLVAIRKQIVSDHLHKMKGQYGILRKIENVAYCLLGIQKIGK